VGGAGRAGRGGVSWRTVGAVVAEILVLLRRPAQMAGWLLALLFAGWSTAEPVLEVLARVGR